jgi:hypothetical protein
MKVGEFTKLHRKFGGMGHPNFVARDGQHLPTNPTLKDPIANADGEAVWA